MRPPITIAARRRPRAFTLIELSVVILIIGILMAFVLAASAAGLESARVKATQALLSKLNAGLEERLDAVLQTQVTPNGAHLWLARVTTPSFPGGSSPLPWGIQGEQRAQVIARMDQIRAEFPDVFFLSNSNDPANLNGKFPISFAGIPFNPAGSQPLGGTAAEYYILPLGNSVLPLYLPDPSYVPGNNFQNPGPGGYDPVLPTNPLGTGYNGASYTAAASLYKLVGYTPRGCNGVDDDGINGVDDLNEGTSDPSGNFDSEAQAKVNHFLQNHRHKTARAEMLYALLVEGLGPLGNVFEASDFRNTEVKDTDNDGVPEFVDGWGEPIQFFRWPFWHRTNQELNTAPLTTGFQVGYQKGDAIYGGPNEVRQQNSLDPNGQLVAVSWWGDNAGNSPMTPSHQMQIVQNYFGPLVDPLANSVNGVLPTPLWDRSASTARRAYMTKFLLVSSGPDQLPGIPLLTDAQIGSQSSLLTSQIITGSVSFTGNSWIITPGEGWAMLLDPTSTLPQWRDPNIVPTLNSDGSFTDYSLDDITNQGLQNRSGGIQ